MMFFFSFPYILQTFLLCLLRLPLHPGATPLFDRDSDVSGAGNRSIWMEMAINR
jgi:hypothetical protein